MDAVYVQFEALLVEEQEAACRKVRIVLRDLGDWAAFLNARSAFLWALAIRSIMPLCQSFNDFHH